MYRANLLLFCFMEIEIYITKLLQSTDNKNEKDDKCFSIKNKLLLCLNKYLNPKNNKQIKYYYFLNYLQLNL